MMPSTWQVTVEREVATARQVAMTAGPRRQGWQVWPARTREDPEIATDQTCTGSTPTLRATGTIWTTW